MTDQVDVIKKSVTAGDYATDPRAGVMNFIIPAGMWNTGGLPPEPPQYWSRNRDIVLRSTVLHEDMWGAAIGIAITKMSSLAWEIDSDVPLRSKRLQELLLATNWTAFISMHLRDFLTTDNGSFIEIVRATSSPVSKVVGIVHLDSMRCTRTGDPEIPVIYVDRRGREHEMKAHQVASLADMPDPSEMLFGVGYCAASRAFRSIYKLSVMERYVSEKVSGRRPLAIHFVNSISPRQLESARAAAEEDAARQGILSYMGAIVVPLLDASAPPDVSTVPLAELPDRFNRKEEFDIAILSYADNIGLDPQDLQPLTGQSLGTGAQSAVLEEKAKGKGLASWRQGFTHLINEYVADELSTFAFIEKDYRDQERQAGISKQRADASKVRVDAGITTAAQELQVLVDADELPKEFLPVDATGDTISDTEKPEQEAAEAQQEPEEEAEIATEQEEAEPPEAGTAKEIILKHLAGQHDQMTHGRGRGGVSGDGISDYIGSSEANTLPDDMVNNLDGGPGKSIQYHGTPKKGIQSFDTSDVYLQDNPVEAKGYAEFRHYGQNVKGGEVLGVRRKPGKTLNLEPEMTRRMEQGDDPDDVISQFLNPARRNGYRYIYLEHPTFTGEGQQRVVISLYPKEDLSVVSRRANKEFAEKAAPDDELQAEIESLADESAALYKQAIKKDQNA